MAAITISNRGGDEVQLVYNKHVSAPLKSSCSYTVKKTGTYFLFIGVNGTISTSSGTTLLSGTTGTNTPGTYRVVNLNSGSTVSFTAQYPSNGYYLNEAGLVIYLGNYIACSSLKAQSVGDNSRISISNITSSNLFYFLGGCGNNISFSVTPAADYVKDDLVYVVNHDTTVIEKITFGFNRSSYTPNISFYGGSSYARIHAILLQLL